MIDDLAHYPSLKPSGVEWLGDVPDHWDVVPNRAIFTEVDDRGYADEPMLSVTIGTGVMPQAALLSNSAKKDSSREDRSAYKLVCKGDIAYNKMRAWQGAIGASEYRGIVSPAYVVQRPNGAADPRFLHYLLRTPRFATEAERLSYGITSDMWSLRPEDFRLIYVCVPPPAEQSAIIKFLDHADRRIRRVVTAKQRLIKLLEEQKQVLIHHSMTRGLDPTTRLKPSGVEWLDAIPEHWDMVPTRAALRISKKLVGDRSSEYQLLSLTKRGVIPRDVEKAEGKFPASFDTYQEVNPGDLVFCLFDIDETPRTVGLSTLGGMITGAYTRCKCDPALSEWVYHYYLAMDNGKHLRPLYTGLRKVITKPNFLSARMPLPPSEERKAILTHIEAASRTTDEAAARTRREVSLLREYRTRLIADVVTGKLDAREAGARLPSEVQEPLDDEVQEPLDDLDVLGNVDDGGIEEPESVLDEGLA